MATAVSTASAQLKSVFSLSESLTSLSPMSILPWQTWVRPAPEPPAVTVIWASGFLAWNWLAASWMSGSNADEPARVSLPLTALVPAEAAAVGAAAEAAVGAAAEAAVGSAAEAAVGAAAAGALVAAVLPPVAAVGELVVAAPPQAASTGTIRAS